VKHPTFWGIDLTSTEGKPSACLGLGKRGELVYFGFLRKNNDILHLLDIYSPQVVAIDAPLSLPMGLCCLEENCSCQPKFSRKNRQCDEELRQQGIPCYPTSKKTFVKDLIYRGIELKISISSNLAYAGQIIEIYPFASKVRLFGQHIPQKTTRRGMAFMNHNLAKILPCLQPYLHLFDHNLCDAAIAAYTALLYHQGKTQALGSVEEGLIFIPD